MSDLSTSTSASPAVVPAGEDPAVEGLRCWLALFASWLLTWHARGAGNASPERLLRTWPRPVEQYFGRLSHRYYSYWLDFLPGSPDAKALIRPGFASADGSWPVWGEVSAYLLSPEDQADVRRIGGLLREITIYNGAGQPPDHALGLLMGGLRLRIRDLVRSHLRRNLPGPATPLALVEHALAAPSDESTLAVDEKRLLIEHGKALWKTHISLRGRVALVLAFFRVNARAPRILAAARCCQVLADENMRPLSQNVFYNRLRGTNEDGRHRKGELDHYLEAVSRIPGLHNLPPPQRAALPVAALNLANELSLRWLIRPDSGVQPLVDAIRQSISSHPLAARLDAV